MTPLLINFLKIKKNSYLKYKPNKINEVKIFS